MKLTRLTASLRGVLLGFLGTLPLSAGHAQAPASKLDQVLRQMDAASTRFHSATADFRWDFYQRVIRDTTTQTGAIFFNKTGSTTEMGARIDPPQAKVIAYKDGKLRLFDPGTNRLTEISAGPNQAQYESFLTLGFGGSGRDLERVWTITDQGAETQSDGAAQIQTEKLDLVAKDPNTRNTFTHVTIWVDPQRGVSLKQQFFTTSEDVRSAVYSHIRLNSNIDRGKFAIKTDKNTTFDRR